MLRRIAWGFALLVGAVVLGVPLWIQFHRHDLLAPDDADLILSIEPVVGPNGFDDLRAAAEAMSGLDQEDVYTRIDRIRRREAWEPEFVEEMLRRNAKALAAFDRGLAAPSGWIPRGAGGSWDEAMAGQPLFRIQLLVKLILCDAQRLHLRGSNAAALERAEYGLRAGLHLSEFGGAELLTFMNAASTQGIAAAELAALVRETRLSDTSSRALAKRIRRYRIGPEAWQRMWSEQYRDMKVTMMNVLQQERSVPPNEVSDYFQWTFWRWLRWLPADYLLQPNRTLSAFAESYREQQRKSTMFCRDALSSPTSSDSDRSSLSMLLWPNPSGRLIHAISASMNDRFQVHRCHYEARLALLEAVVAIRGYAGSTGDIPARLDALVPRYLDAVPLDPFDGAPLRYSKADAVVYSIGDDLVDSGGSDPPSQSERGEPTISVAF